MIPSLKIRIRPLFSITNNRPLPSPACVIWAGNSRPETNFFRIHRFGSNVPNTRISRQATQPWLWLVSTNTLFIRRGGSIEMSRTAESSVTIFSNRLYKDSVWESSANHIS